jgi:hypothetical protein
LKALIIILAVVALSFVGLVVYGQTRTDRPSRACEQLPKPDSDGDIEVPDDWCPPSIAKATRPLQARFAPGLDLPKPNSKVEITISPQGDNFFTIPPTKPNKRRTAKLTLISGSSAIVEGPNDAKQCLCKPGEPLASQLLLGGTCSGEWRKDNSNGCTSAGKWGTIPVDWTGGQLKFDKGPSATVEVK